MWGRRKAHCGMSVEGTRGDRIKGSVLGPLMGGQSSRMRGVVSAAVSPLRKTYK